MAVARHHVTWRDTKITFHVNRPLSFSATIVFTYHISFFSFFIHFVFIPFIFTCFCWPSFSHHSFSPIFIPYIFFTHNYFRQELFSSIINCFHHA
jgi:hypothetical protein